MSWSFPYRSLVFPKVFISFPDVVRIPPCPSHSSFLSLLVVLLLCVLGSLASLCSCLNQFFGRRWWSSTFVLSRRLLSKVMVTFLQRFSLPFLKVPPFPWRRRLFDWAGEERQARLPAGFLLHSEGLSAVHLFLSAGMCSLRNKRFTSIITGIRWVFEFWLRANWGERETLASQAKGDPRRTLQSLLGFSKIWSLQEYKYPWGCLLVNMNI